MQVCNADFYNQIMYTEYVRFHMCTLKRFMSSIICDRIAFNKSGQFCHFCLLSQDMDMFCLYSHDHAFSYGRKFYLFLSELIFQCNELLIVRQIHYYPYTVTQALKPGNVWFFAKLTFCGNRRLGQKFFLQNVVFLSSTFLMALKCDIFRPLLMRELGNMEITFSTKTKRQAIRRFVNTSITFFNIFY